MSSTERTSISDLRVEVEVTDLSPGRRSAAEALRVSVCLDTGADCVELFERVAGIDNDRRCLKLELVEAGTALSDEALKNNNCRRHLPLLLLLHNH